MNFFDYNWLNDIDDNKVLSTPHWRGHAEKLAHAAYQRADGSRSYVRDAWHKFALPARQMGDAEALPALRRAVSVLNAMAGLDQVDRDTLGGRLDPRIPTGHLTGTQITELRLRLSREVWDRDPALQEYRAEIDATAARVAEQQDRQREADAARLSEAEEARAAAPGFVHDLDKRRFRLDVVGGRARVFPASRLDAKDAAFLAAHNAAVVSAVMAEWTA